MELLAGLVSMDELTVFLNFFAALLTLAYIGRLISQIGVTPQIHFSEYGFIKRSLLNQQIRKARFV